MTFFITSQEFNGDETPLVTLTHTLPVHDTFITSQEFNGDKTPLVRLSIFLKLKSRKERYNNKILVTLSCRVT